MDFWEIEQKMKCKICDSTTENIFSGKILNKYDVKYFHCKNCNFLSTEEPYWLDEAYAESINTADTGIMMRNNTLAVVASIIIYHLFDKDAKFLDYAGGYGIFTRLMRDNGFDFCWHDPHTENLVARGFEYKKDDKIELITSFESFEHFAEPMKEMENLLNISENILLTTTLLPNPIPKPDEWWYYVPDKGQHICFYSSETFDFIAKKYGLNYYSVDSIHLLTKKTIDDEIFQHIMLLKKNKTFNQTQSELYNKVKNSMKSKTISDFEYIVSLQRNNSGIKS